MGPHAGGLQKVIGSADQTAIASTEALFFSTGSRLSGPAGLRTQIGWSLQRHLTRLPEACAEVA